MDDCNKDGDAEFLALHVPDSSMDDCNIMFEIIDLLRVHVQIPLWTIVTLLRLPLLSGKSGSDSSMDDCNARVTWRSSSLGVQIPLWTM